jgi:DNA-binding PadR family transcriptional regulator
MSKVTKPRTSPKMLDLLVTCRVTAKNGDGTFTAKTVESNAIYMGRLRDAGLIRAVDTVKSGQRGRPALIFRLTDTGRGRADRALAKREQGADAEQEALAALTAESSVEFDTEVMAAGL